MSRLPKPGARAPRAPGGPAARRARSSGDRARRGVATGASSPGRCWVTRRYVRTRRVPPPAACASPKNPRSFPRAFRSRFRRARRARPTGAVRRLSSRACLSARGRAPTGGRANPLDPRTPAGRTRASVPPNAGGRRRPPRSSRRSPSKTRFTTRRSRRGVRQTPRFSHVETREKNQTINQSNGVSSRASASCPSSPLTNPSDDRAPRVLRLLRTRTCGTSSRRRRTRSPLARRLVCGTKCRACPDSNRAAAADRRATTITGTAPKLWRSLCSETAPTTTARLYRSRRRTSR